MSTYTLYGEPITYQEWSEHYLGEDPIHVQVGRMRIAFPAGTPQVEIAKKVKAIQDAPKKSEREAARYLKMPKLTRLTKPTEAMLRASSLPKDHPDYLGMPEEARTAAVLALARKRRAAWLKNPKGDPVAAAYADSDSLRAMLNRTSDERLEHLIESNIAKGVVSGNHAATLVECWDELERRRAGRQVVA
jgi:hypothetical protein